jgi:hypothetical protein
MSAVIKIPAELEKRIAGVATAQGKNVEQVAIEALTMVFDPESDAEDARTLQALEGVRKGTGRPAREVLEEIRGMLGIPQDATRPIS